MYEHEALFVEYVSLDQAINSTLVCLDGYITPNVLKCPFYSKYV